MVVYQMGIIEILPLLLQNCLPFGSADFTASAALQVICSSTLSATVLWRTCPAPPVAGFRFAQPRCRDLRLAYAANSTLAKLRYKGKAVYDQFRFHFV